MKQYISWHRFAIDVESLCQEISQYKKQYKYIYPVVRGGLIPGTILAYRFNLPIITSKETMLSKPLIDILIVDDIVDSGNTLFEYYEKEYDIASVYVRNETAIFIPNYFGVAIETMDWLIFPYDDNPDVEDTVSLVKEKTNE